MQRISQSLTGNHALSWLLKRHVIKKKMPSLSTNQRSVILPFIDKEEKHLYADNFSPNTTKELNKKENWRKTREKSK